MSEKIKVIPLIEKAREFFRQTIEAGNPIYPLYPEHAQQVENWSLQIIPYFPEANEEIIRLSAWLHDIGWADGNLEEDHAIKSEVFAREFLTRNNYPQEKIDAVAHCVRSHRCKDVQPETIEAKILVAADSASHMTDAVYLIMLSQSHLSKNDILAKLERDYRDVFKFLPQELFATIDDLYEAWKHLLELFPEIE